MSYPSAGDPFGESATLRGLSAGQRMFGRFTLKRMLGRGGMGVVWLARDEKLERDVALKFLPEIVALDERAVDDLKHETRRALELTHPNIVRIYDLLEDETTAAISMEYVDGASLAGLALQRPSRVFDVDELGRWIPQLCAALDYAHNEAKVVHRDLKPANLMLNSNGQLKIADFGISATVSETVARVSRFVPGAGTPVFMSPQQMLGRPPTPADDIYSLGATLYDLLTGKPPFFRGNIVAQVEREMPPPITERRAELGAQGESITVAWEQAIAACLAKNPEERPATAGDLLSRLSQTPPLEFRQSCRTASDPVENTRSAHPFPPPHQQISPPLPSPDHPDRTCLPTGGTTRAHGALIGTERQRSKHPRPRDLMTFLMLLTMLGLSTVLVLIANAITGNASMPLGHLLPLTFGQMLGTNLIPAVVAGVACLFRRTFRTFFVAWLVTFVLLAIPYLYQAHYDRTAQGVQAPPTKQASEQTGMDPSFRAALSSAAPDAREFVDGHRTKFTTKGHPKAKGVAMTIEFPNSWRAMEGERPNVLQKFVSEQGRGLEMALIITTAIPPETDSGLSDSDLAQLISVGALQQMVPKESSLLSARVSTIEGLPAGILEYSTRQERLGLVLDTLTVTYVFVADRTLVQLQCSVSVGPGSTDTVGQKMKRFGVLFALMTNSIVLENRWK